LFQAFAHLCAARLNPNVEWLLLQTSTGWSGSSPDYRHRARALDRDLRKRRSPPGSKRSTAYPVARSPTATDRQPAS